MKLSKKKSAAFTFIEVLIAVSLMATAATLIIGVQSSSLWRTVRDRNAQQAALAARRILAMIEAQDANQQNSGFSGTVPDVLQQLGYQFSNDRSERENLSRLNVDIQSVPAEIPGISADSLVRLKMEVSWGPGPEDRSVFIYFVAK